MEETINNETVTVEQKKENKGLSLLKKGWSGITNTGKKACTWIADTCQETKAKIDESNRMKQLEKDIENQFNNKSMEYKLVLINDKGNNVFKKYFALTDYDKKLITLYGEVKNLLGKYFVDSENQKFIINVVRQNQTVDIKLVDIVYTRKATILEFTLKNDDKTKQDVAQIINNSINITNSTISKSDIGNKDNE